MRSVWKGHIRFSLVTIPIQVFNAIESKGNIRFKQLHDSDHGAVGYDKVCRACNEKVGKGQIVKGYEYEPDQFVIIEDKDFDNIKLKSTRAIEIESFVSIEEVHPSLFEAVYFVGPNGDIAKQTYSLFRETLEKTKKAGIGRIILRDREDVVLITPHKNGMIMYKLRYPYEIRSIENVPDLEPVDADDAQVKLAEQLVESLTMPFAEVNFEDRFRDALLEMVERKIDGKEIVSIAEDEEKPVVDIMSALKESIDKAKSKKSA